MKGTRNAFALSIVMWLVAALLFGIATLTRFSKDTTTITKILEDKLETRLEAEDILELLKYYITTSNYDSISFINNKEKIGTKDYKLPRKLFLDGRVYKLSKNVTISIKDTSALLNLNYPKFVLISKMATDESEREKRFTISDSIYDWIDKDSAPHLNGAEESYYKIVNEKEYVPRNVPILQDIEEMHIIKGIDKEAWNRIKKYIFFGTSGRINVALIDNLFLQNLLDLSPFEREYFQKTKLQDIKKYIQMIKKHKNYNNDIMSTALSFEFKIKIVVIKNKARTVIHALMNCRLSRDHGIVINRYKIN
jgi:hypothetical protein